jgi:exodeoxyribonuclease V alpha subunit
MRGKSLAFLPHLRKTEEGIAAKIRALVEAPPAYPQWCEAKTGKTLAPSQKDALQTALTCRVVIITGRPIMRHCESPRQISENIGPSFGSF